MGVLEQPFEGSSPTWSAATGRHPPTPCARSWRSVCPPPLPPAVMGDRLSDMARAVTVGGLGLSEFCRLTVVKALNFVDSLQLEGNQGGDCPHCEGNPGSALLPSGCGAAIPHPEPQRRDPFRRRASGFVWLPRLAHPSWGVLYILDEPSIGLHQRDNSRLLETLEASAGFGQHPGGGGA